VLVVWTRLSNECQIRRTILDLNARLEKLACQRQDDRVVLVVWRAVDSLERINPRKFMEEPLKVSAELHSAVPRLKSNAFDQLKRGLYDHPTEKWPKNSRHS
jgi:hypothetical protein